MDDFKDIDCAISSTKRKSFRFKNIKIVDKSNEIENCYHAISRLLAEEDEICSGSYIPELSLVEQSNQKIEDPSLQEPIAHLKVLHETLSHELENASKEFNTNYTTTSLSIETRDSFAAMLLFLTHHPLLKISKQTIDLIQILFQNESENGFEQVFLEHGIIDLYRDSFDSFTSSHTSFASFVLTLASFGDFNDETAQQIFSTFPLEELFDTATHFSDRKTHNLEKGAIGSLLQYCMLLFSKDIEYSLSDFELMLRVVQLNYEIWNENYFSSIVHGLRNILVKWPIDNIPLSKLEEIGIHGIIKHCFSLFKSENELIGETSLIFDSLSFLSQHDYFINDIDDEEMRSFLYSTDQCVQQSAFDFWMTIVEKNPSEWVSVITMDNIGELINSHFDDFQFNTKIVALDMISSFVTSLSNEDAFSFVFENNFFHFFIDALPLSEATTKRMKAILMLVSLYDTIPVPKRHQYVETVLQLDRDEIEELANTDNDEIESLANAILQQIETYST